MTRLTTTIAIVALLSTYSFGSELIPGTPGTLQESVTFQGVVSWDAQGSAGNTILASGFTGGYLADQFIVNGVLNNTMGDSGTFASEADIRVGTTNIGGGSGATYVDTTVITDTTTSVTPFDPAGASLEFYESFDDVAGAEDQRWDTVTIDAYGGGTPDMIVNGNFGLGILPDDGTLACGPGQFGNAYHSNVSGGLDFFTFEVPAGTQGPASYLNITTSDGGTGDGIDTELFLFDSAGNFLNTDDDGGAGTYSQLTFGADPLTIDPAPGDDGPTLAPGMYTIAVGGFNTTVGADIGSLVAGTSSGDYNLKVSYLVPEPSVFGLIAMGLMGLGMIRRK